ncbi:hypothetical protein BURK2_00818 [Burkholderiales bacterium]|nr:MAG: hypothetical protein F9K47_17020 [Burkholderiales bacterium]CAG0962543.1 hypothetical protein BURK2_00818 [Burkholderiales bacterium]
METILQDELYCVAYDAVSGTIELKGTLRLNGTEEYAPVVAVLHRALDAHRAVTLNLAGLDFLNSSGIATLSRFVIEARNRGGIALTIRGSRQIAWQGKSLINLQRLMPALVMEFT